MLDSNTDRSYFMIGAVIVGAAIIAGALFIFGETLFGADGKLISMMNTLFDKAVGAVGDINPVEDPSGGGGK